MPSEFDFANRQSYSARRCVAKSRDFADAVARETIELLMRTQGAPRVVYEYRCCAGYASRWTQLRIRSSFKAIAASVLLTSSAPRQRRAVPQRRLVGRGDVVGEPLSRVIIESAVASPGDTITAARIEAILKDGGDASRLQVPSRPGDAAGLGRLIRTAKTGRAGRARPGSHDCYAAVSRIIPPAPITRLEAWRGFRS